MKLTKYNISIKSYKIIIRPSERYELKCPLGKGKYSVVFKAMDNETDKHVVVKILKPVRKPKINREIKILQSVKGSFIIVKLTFRLS